MIPEELQNTEKIKIDPQHRQQHSWQETTTVTAVNIGSCERYQVDLQNEKTTLLTVWRTVTGRKMNIEQQSSSQRQIVQYRCT